MTGAELSRALTEIPFLGRSDLVSAGVLDADDDAGWMKFARDPHRAASTLRGERIERLAARVALVETPASRNAA